MNDDLLDKAEELQLRLFSSATPEDAGVLRMLIARIRELESRPQTAAQAREEIANIADRRAKSLAKIGGIREAVVELRTIAHTIRSLNGQK